MHHKTIFPAAVLCLLGTSCSERIEQSDQDLPNIVIIYCDDMGYGDIGCFGADDINTPNIDKIASRGIQFTEFYSAASVCSASRAALLTGRLPRRTGVTGVFFPDSYTGLPVDEITIAELLKEKGYVNGIAGKWHLGHRKKFLPLQQGFDEYFGMPYSNDMSSVVYIRDNEVVDFHVDQKTITRTYTEEALDFIDRYHQRPFFLYLAHSMPHVPIYASEDFTGTSERGLYGDVIQEIDWSVGQVLDKLEQHGILDNTLVVFSSDNGPWLVMRELGGSAGILRGGKFTSFEGGMRVPTVAMWPDKIPGGSVYDDVCVMTDWLPTIADITGIELPGDRAYDGVSILNVLQGKGERKNRKFLYFEGSVEKAYRSGDWKVKKAFQGFPGAPWKIEMPPHPPLLINLKEDPGETRNLAEEKPELLKQLFGEMDEMREKMGEMPAPLVVRTSADESHNEYLKNKYNGKEYWNRDSHE